MHKDYILNKACISFEFKRSLDDDIIACALLCCANCLATAQCCNLYNNCRRHSSWNDPEQKKYMSLKS